MSCKLRLTTLLLPVLLSMAPYSVGPAYGATLVVADTEISLNLPARVTASQRDKITRWIRYTANAAVGLYGHLPLDRFSVNIRFADGSREPVPWGQVTRSRPPQVTFHINPDAPLQALIDDWTSVHEFSHLFLPYPGGRGIWFSEGLASYYQNVLMARAGTYTANQAWEKMYSGFRRGRQDTRMQHLTLKKLSPRMWDTGSYMRVYWSGAAYFMNVDVALRSRENNPSSLDKALAGFYNCCLNLRRRWTTEGIIRQLDRQVGGDIFWREYRKIIDSKRFPDVQAASALLGIRERNNRLVFADSPLRNTIIKSL